MVGMGMIVVTGMGEVGIGRVGMGITGMGEVGMGNVCVIISYN